jgi:flagellin
MSFSINTNLGALAALQSLDATQQSLNNTTNIISTGQLVSSASNNPAIYSISQTMQANIAGLAAVQDNLSFAQSVVGVASSGASQISSQLATLQNTITQGQQSGLNATTMQNQINSILQNINQFADSATFNGVNLLNGTSSPLTTTANITGSTLTLSNQSATTTGLGLAGLQVNSTAVAVDFSSSLAPSNGSSLTLSNGTNSYVFEFSNGTTALTATPTPTTQVFAVQINSTMSNTQMIGALMQSLQQNGFGAGYDSSGNLDITGNNVVAASSSSAITGATLSSVGGATAAISVVTNAISTMNTKSATLGAFEDQLTGLQNFSSSLSTSLTTGLGALTDANMAAESAQLNSLQTKQQLAIRTLSIANAQPQVLLNLFQ